MTNKLCGALKGKDFNSGDEYYTRKEDIENFLPYWDFSDKIIYCPCDTEKSEFVKYFKQKGKCKELIYTSNDFRTNEHIFEKADIIITNPPFSLKIDFLNILRKYKKDFILILSTISTKNFSISELNNEIFIYKDIRQFNVPDNQKNNKVGCKWYSNIFNPNKSILCNHKMTFSGNYKIEVDRNGNEYKYFNFKDIPKGIKEPFLIPITFDTGYKEYFPEIKIIKKLDNCFDKETNKKCFARFLVQIKEL